MKVEAPEGVKAHGAAHAEDRPWGKLSEHAGLAFAEALKAELFSDRSSDSLDAPEGAGTPYGASCAEPQPEPPFVPRCRQHRVSDAGESASATPITPTMTPALDVARARTEAAVGQLQHLQSLVGENADLRSVLEAQDRRLRRVEQRQAVPATPQTLEEHNWALKERVARLEAENETLRNSEARLKQYGEDALVAARQLELAMQGVLARNAELERQLEDSRRSRRREVRVTLGTVRRTSSGGAPSSWNPAADVREERERSPSKERSKSPSRETKFGGA